MLADIMTLFEQRSPFAEGAVEAKPSKPQPTLEQSDSSLFTPVRPGHSGPGACLASACVVLSSQMMGRSRFGVLVNSTAAERSEILSAEVTRCHLSTGGHDD